MKGEMCMNIRMKKFVKEGLFDTSTCQVHTK